MQVQVKFKSINTFQVVLQGRFISEESCGAVCVPKAHCKAGGYGEVPRLVWFLADGPV